MNALRFSLMLVAIAAAARPAQTFQTAASLEGIVVEMGGNTPLPQTTLELRSPTNASIRYPGVSADDGRFVFPSVPAGQYLLAASRAGFIRTSYGQRGPNGATSMLQLEPGRRLSNVRLSMMPSAAISGRVHTRDGEPVVNGQMHASRVSYKDGWRMLTPVASQMTDDRGEYRLFGLTPGHYYVSAQPEPTSHLRSPSYAGLPPLVPGGLVISSGGGMMGGIPDPAMRPGTGVEWAPVYFGGVTDEFAATAIDVRAGNDLSGMDIVVDRRPLLPLTGSVTGPNGEPVSSATIIATPVAPGLDFVAMSTINVMGGNLIVTPSAPVRTGASGQFNMAGLRPGSYLVTAMADRQGQRLAGQTTLEVSGSDRLSVSITLNAAWNIEGRIVVENGAAAPLDLTKFSVSLRSTVHPAADSPPATPSVTGAFTLRNVIRGDYLVSVGPLSNLTSPEWKNAYVKSISLGQIDIRRDGMHLDRAPERPVEIVIGRNGGVLSGRVFDANREILANAMVALLPDETRRQQIDLYRNAMTDSSGSYRFDRIPPGSYKLFAWEDVEIHSWRDAAFMRLYEDRGAPVTVRETTDQRFDVTAIPPR